MDEQKMYREYLEELAEKYDTTAEVVELAGQAFNGGCPGLMDRIQEHIGGSSSTLVHCIGYVSCMRKDQIMGLLAPIRRLTAIAEAALTFEQWMGKVDDCVWKLAGVSVYDLPDQCFRDWFDDEIEPRAAAARAIKEVKD